MRVDPGFDPSHTITMKVTLPSGQDPEQALMEFAATVVNAGTDALIVHARKAWLQGLSLSSRWCDKPWCGSSTPITSW